MENQIKASYSEVTDFIKFIIRMSGLFDVDEEGYVISKIPPVERIKININNENKDLIVFQKEIKDNEAVIINPFNESIGIESKDKYWIYSILSLGLSAKIISLINAIIDTKLSSDDEGISIRVAKFISEFSGIDKKFKDEFNMISKDTMKFMNVFYRKKFKEGRFRCLIFEPDGREEFNLRKKSWKILDKMFSMFFNIDIENSEDPEQDVIDKYSYKTNSITCPKLTAMLMTYNKIYIEINKYFEYMNNDEDDSIVDLDEFAHYINKIDACYHRVKWAVQPIVNDEDGEMKKPFSPVPQNNIIESSNFINTNNNDNFSPMTPDGVPIVIKKAPGIVPEMSRFSPPFSNNMGMMNTGYNNGMMNTGGYNQNMMMNRGYSGGIMNPGFINSNNNSIIPF